MKKIIAMMLVCMNANAALPRGNATWVYDINAKGSTPASFAPWINYYNGNTLAPHNIPTIFSYGGDMEIIAGKFVTSFPINNQTAAALYKKAYGVKNVIATVDGNMSEGQSYSPNLSILTATQVQAWADSTAKLFCGFDFIDGLQIDLEPARAPYLANLLVFLKQLSADLMLSTNGCLTSAHPEGRSLGVFLSAGSATPAVFTAIGTNGYVVMSGYDLSGNPPGTPTEPTLYGQQLTANLKLLLSNAGSKGSYIIGIPAAASTHEFSDYMPANLNAVMGYRMYSKDQPNYTTQAIQAIQNVVKTAPGYLGTSLWGFSLEIEVPIRSRSLFYPSNPFQQAGQMNYYQGNL